MQTHQLFIKLNKLFTYFNKRIKYKYLCTSFLK